MIKARIRDDLAQQETSVPALLVTEQTTLNIYISPKEGETK